MDQRGTGIALALRLSLRYKIAMELVYNLQK